MSGLFRGPSIPMRPQILPLGAPAPAPDSRIEPMVSERAPVHPAVKAGGLAAAIAGACVIAAPLVSSFEGKRNVAYADPIGIPTSCYGHTGPEVRVGQRSSDAQCQALLQGDLRKHAQAAARIAPPIVDRPPVFAAVTSFVYNVGAGTFQKSTAAKLFNQRRYRDGCLALGRYVYAGGRKLPGLVRRRNAEVALCLKGA